MKSLVVSAYLKENGRTLEIKDNKIHPNLILALALTLPVNHIIIKSSNVVLEEPRKA